jgi:ATP-dependent 26S proteasome regulatory subunit
MPNKAQIEQTLMMMGSETLPLAHRAQMMVEVMVRAKEEEEASQAVAKEVFNRLGNATVDEEVKAKAKALDEILEQVESAPLRPATFIGLCDVSGTGVPHAQVAMDNGEVAFVVIYDQAEAKRLKLGDRIMLDAHAKIMVRPSPDPYHPGTIARFERKTNDVHIEVLTRADEKKVLIAVPEVLDQIAAGQIKPGAQIIMGAGEKLATCAVPEAKDTFYRFLDRGSIPDVRVDRDIGNPPKVISQVALHVREEMTRPELRRKFRLRPCITRLLCGVSGSGKTLAVQAIHRLLYEIMAEVTKTPIEELPPRVFRMRSSQMLSMWFGESDKNIDRLFDEVEQKADEKWNGHTLPVMVVLEEAEGLGRHRGGEQIYDRIMTVILQRLDPNREGLANKLVVFLSTTNEPHLVDPAFLRRIGGTVETFGRLDHRGFADILHKHIEGLPLRDGREKAPKKIASGIVEIISFALFESGEDHGVVELTYQGHNEPVIKYRRDFLTGALIDRAVQSAAATAWEESLAAKSEAALSAPLLARSLDQQILSVAHQLHPENVHQYTDLPDGVRVTRVRRIQQTS